jgi:hypothetical protein
VINTTVIGGLSKLLSYFKKEYNPESIITYADRRYGEGLSYSQCGFSFLRKSSPSYFYINRTYTTRYSRQSYQKHLLQDKLEIFDPVLTEWQNMQLNGYDRIWDCGVNVYVWDKEQ